MKLKKYNISLRSFVIVFILSIILSCEQNKTEKLKNDLEYSTEQKNEIKQIISAIIIPEQNKFPPLLTYSKPKKIYISKNTDLKKDSISSEYLKNNLFQESEIDKLQEQNNFKLENFRELLQNLNLSEIDSTKGTITKVVSIPILNSVNNNAFVRVTTLDSGHFLDTTDYWLQKEQNMWKIVRYEMIIVH